MFKTPLQVWEYDILRVGTGPFKQHHFDSLKVYLNCNPDCGYYSLLDNAIRFNQYVGAIQVGDICIEVLPKTDRHKTDKAMWQQVLIDMIFISSRVPVSITTQAQMLTHRRRVLDAYFQLFLNEVKTLQHQGLAKKYRQHESNQYALRGRLLFKEQLQHNLVHAERFYVAHSTYSHNNIYNAILLKTLKAMASMPLPSYISSQVKEALLHFPECNNFTLTDKLFRRLSYDRKTAHYRKAISFAEIILQQYHPDVRTGRQSILAIMFDMNKLWEAFVYAALFHALDNTNNASIEPKPTSYFFSSRIGTYLLEPDIVVQLSNEEKVVIDTKWKFNQRTSIADLRQMYAYGHYFKAKRSFLLYPHCNATMPVKTVTGFFSENDMVGFEKQGCGLVYVDLIKNDRLNLDVLADWIQSLARNSYNPIDATGE